MAGPHQSLHQNSTCSRRTLPVESNESHAHLAGRRRLCTPSAAVQGFSCELHLQQALPASVSRTTSRFAIAARRESWVVAVRMGSDSSRMQVHERPAHLSKCRRRGTSRYSRPASSVARRGRPRARCMMGVITRLTWTAAKARRRRMKGRSKQAPKQDRMPATDIRCGGRKVCCCFFLLRVTLLSSQ